MLPIPSILGLWNQQQVGINFKVPDDDGSGSIKCVEPIIVEKLSGRIDN